MCLALDPPPLGLMQGYQGDDGAVVPLSGAAYRTGDIAMRDADGHFTYVGRADDVFKASDYRISPFELESALIEHPPVAEAAVVPSPDPVRLAVPKAFVALAPGTTRRTATRRCRSSAICARIWRRSSGSAGSNSPNCRRRSPARSGASNCAAPSGRTAPKGPGAAPREFWEEDFPELR